MNPVQRLAVGAVAAVVIGCVALAADKKDVVRDYPLDKIAAHTYVIHGGLGYFSVANQGFMNNPAFVVTREGVVVIDPGSSVQAGRMVMKQLRKVTDKPVTHVLNTHVHPDHWFGNQAVLEVYPRAMLMAHPETIKRGPVIAEEWVTLIHTLTNGFTAGTRGDAANVAIGDGAEVKTGGVT